MKPYELMLIITPDHEESQVDALIENVKGIIEADGNLVHIDVWGKKRLTYPIRKRTEGFYVIYVFECEASFVAQLNQALRVNEAILRHMIVLYEDDLEKLKAAPDDSAEDTPESEQDITESEEEIKDTKESSTNSISSEISP